MKFSIHTPVEKDLETVFNGFDRNLFMKLVPPLMQLNLTRFDGCFVGDEIMLENVILGVIKQNWHNKIVSRNEQEDQKEFVDEGIVLPPGLSSWRHRHIVQKDGEGAKIIDDIEYGSSFKLLEYVMFPAIYLIFWFRKSIYRDYFKK